MVLNWYTFELNKRRIVHWLGGVSIQVCDPRMGQQLIFFVNRGRDGHGQEPELWERTQGMSSLRLDRAADVGQHVSGRVSLPVS